MHDVVVLFIQDGTMAGQQVEILQELEKMGNLESVVTEQKIRIEKLRTTYESLKAQHLQLQDVSDMNQEKLSMWHFLLMYVCVA